MWVEIFVLAWIVVAIASLRATALALVKVIDDHKHERKRKADPAILLVTRTGIMHEIIRITKLLLFTVIGILLLVTDFQLNELARGAVYFMALVIVSLIGWGSTLETRYRRLHMRLLDQRVGKKGRIRT